ncbi:lactonase family protein [Colwellia sp. E2M01]|uniref:lactonase family protein n=1 Tax=Colwellia sp. E2M01 TaxID=2841561 RepID=UPI001C081084|nr:lactonase family protein [Colwellia sp. E2M01]MBU2870427.1 lactonase family protein [Colwellia sp. E2M01]
MNNPLLAIKKNAVFSVMFLSLSLLSCGTILCTPTSLAKQNILNSTQHKKTTVLAGTYTSENGSEGLYVFDYDLTKHTFDSLRLVKKANNPSFGAYDITNQRFYGVEEASSGTISSFLWNNEEQEMNTLNMRSSEGADPCYVAISPNKKQLAITNYSSGNIAIFTLNKDSGSIESLPQIINHKGQGVDQQRQKGPHAHWAQWSPYGSYIYAVDLGLDKVFTYPIDKQTGKISTASSVFKMSPGSGPRHMVFHPKKPISYILNELNNTVVTTSITPNGELVAQQEINTLPADFTKHSQGGHIAIGANGQYLYVSNRGHNSIAVFHIDAVGRLELVQHMMLKEQWPRFFLITSDGKSMLVANQNSDNITSFIIEDNGRINYTGEMLKLSKPVYLTQLSF